MTSTSRLMTVLPVTHRDRLMDLARDVFFPQDTRIFEEESPADKFWIIHTGTVALDLHVPQRGRVMVDTLEVGDLLGWSWLFPPHRWHYGAEAFSPVRAHEFDAVTARKVCESDHELGLALANAVAEVLATRLEVARTKLLDQYMLHGAIGI
jgi:CRP-like cAMP-binding protein